MSNLLKIAIPLLNDEIEWKDIQNSSGFVGAYFEDKNRPFLNNHLFLLYDAESKEENSLRCFYKLNKLKNVYSTKTIYIKDKPYTLFTFTIDSVIRRLRDGNIILNPTQKQKVLSFWKDRDAWIMNNILLGTMYERPEPSILPEEDYMPELSSHKKREILV